MSGHIKYIVIAFVLSMLLVILTSIDYSSGNRPDPRHGGDDLIRAIQERNGNQGGGIPSMVGSAFPTGEEQSGSATPMIDDTMPSVPNISMHNVDTTGNTTILNNGLEPGTAQTGSAVAPPPTEWTPGSTDANGYYPPPPMPDTQTMPPGTPHSANNPHFTTTNGMRVAFSGVRVYKVEPNGERTQMPDGVHRMADGLDLVVRGGKKIIINN